MSTGREEQSNLWGVQAEGVGGYCANCTALRQVEDATCEDCGGARPAGGWPALAAALDPFLGRVLMERYLLDKVEGRGASSTVYRARSLVVPKRFAIKLVKLGFSDPMMAEHARQRLEREVRAVGMLRSPHIVRIYDMMEVGQGWVALVMDHIVGQTLDARIRQRGPMSTGQACRLLRQIANGLVEAHQNGMVHRDIKPQNIMLERLPDGSDFAYLLDFGVVRLKDESAMTQGFVGTPLFASPEQAVAEMGVGASGLAASYKGVEVDLRSDIYSLGATFFYMLTGRAPFEHALSVDVLRAHLQEEAPRLSEVASVQDFPADIEALVARMLAKMPADRPPNLFRVIDALQARESGQFPVLSASSAAEPSEPLLPGGSGEAERAPHTDRRARHDSATLLGPVGPMDGDDARAAETGRLKDVKRARVDTGANAARPATIPPGTQGVTLERLARRTAHGHAFARSVRISAVSDGRLAVLVDSYNEIWALDAQTLRPICTPPASRVCAVAASGVEVFVGLGDGSIHRVAPQAHRLESLWPMGAAKANQKKVTHAAVTALATTSDADLLVAATEERELLVGRAQPGAPGGAFVWSACHTDVRFSALALSKRGDLLAAAEECTVRLSASDQPEVTLVELHVGAPVLDMAFSNDGDLLAVLTAKEPSAAHAGDHFAPDAAQIMVFQPLCERKLFQFQVDAPTPRNIYFSAHNLLHGMCVAHGRVGCWDLMAERQVAEQP